MEGNGEPGIYCVGGGYDMGEKCGINIMGGRAAGGRNQ